MARRWAWILASAPAAASVLAWAVLRSGGHDPLLWLSVAGKRSELVLAAGMLLSALLLVAIAPAMWVRRRQEARLADQQAAATQERLRFLRRLDHELKNPLTAILAGLAGLDSAAAMPERRETVDKVTAQAKRLGRLTADLRKLADLETMEIEWADVDVGRMLHEVHAAIQESPHIPGRRVTVTIPSAPWPLPAAHGDPDLLFLAVYNLLDNALKFSRAGDAVELRAREDRGSVVIEVADTGPGIAADDVPYVWEELYRGQEGRGAPGSGMGLALVRAVVERHRGSVELTTRPGQGTVVALHLPVAADAKP